MKLIFIVALFGISIVSQQTAAQMNSFSKWQIGIASGEGRSRFELNFEENKKLRPSTVRIDITKKALYQWRPLPSVSIDLDLRTNIYKLDDPFNETSIKAISLVPLWNFHLEFNQQVKPFIAFGIGAAYLSNKNWMDRKLGSRFNFEDTFELGINFNPHKVAVGISHFSNADVSPPNHGANVTYLSYAYSF